jgi:hypothetical protein
MNGFGKYLLVVAGSVGFGFSPQAGASTIYTSTNGAAGITADLDQGIRL